MKTFIKTISQLALMATVFFGGAVFADAASFDLNPSSNTGITSIVDYSCDECGGEQTSVNADIDNPGDSMTITVFTDFMARRDSNEPVHNARARYFTKDVSNATSSSYEFRSRLQASGVSSVTDSVFVHNLPDSYSIEYIGGHVENEHGIDGDGNGSPDNICPNTSAYNYQHGLQSSLFTSSGQDLGTLDNVQGSWCDQGTVVVKYEITNTESNTSYSWYTGPWSDWGSCINGEKKRTRTVECRDNNGNYTTSSNCSGSEPHDEETTTNGCNVVVNLNVTTDFPTDVQDDSARLNGLLSEGGNAEVWFALTTNGNPSCTSFSQRQDVSGSYSSGDQFDKYVNDLSPNTTYYYRACAEQDGTPNQGIVRTFTTDDDNTSGGFSWHTGPWSAWGSCSNGVETRTRTVQCRNNDTNQIVSDSNCSSSKPDDEQTQSCGGGSNDTEPEAETKDPDNIEETSAELNGRIKMNDVNNGIVFFVYGEDESQIEDVPSNYNEYADIDNDGDDLKKYKFSGDNDQDSWRNYDKVVSGLDEDTRHYYRICVEFKNSDGDDELECGHVEDFRTEGDDNDDNDSDIETKNPDEVGYNFAKICGDLKDDGGDSNLQTWIEFKKYGTSGWSILGKRDRGEGRYCERVGTLAENTRYEYRACSNDGCDSVVRFTTPRRNVTTKPPQVTTGQAHSIRSNFAVLPGIYVSNAPRATVWFQYGRGEVLNKQTRTYTKFGAHGEFSHNFTQLRSNQRYCYRAVIKTDYGTDAGSTKCFTTPSGQTTVKPPVVVIEEDDDPEIDLNLLGLGLSLIRLEIDDDQETVTQGQTLTYDVTWENISELDLTDLDLKVEIPREVQITSTSRGRLDQDKNAIFYTIDELDAEEDGGMTITGIVVNGSVGDALTADATIAFDNPVNDAQENATDYDVDEYVVTTALGTASVFGLSNIGFLGWLVILLGLILVFLVARWLYLEREELRAQAFVHGYGRPAAPYMMPPAQDNYYAPPVAAPAPAPAREVHYVEQTPAPQAAAPVAPEVQTVNVNPAGEREDYRPYRPNRG